MNLISDLAEIWPFLAAIVPVIGGTWASYHKLVLMERWLLHHRHDPDTGEVQIPAAVLRGGAAK